MTLAELDAQLHHLRRVLRPAFFGGGVVVASVEVAILATTFRTYPLAGHDRNALAWYFVAFIACWVPILVWYLVLRRLLAKSAPKCERCHHAVTLLEQDRILSTGRCPKCGYAIVAVGSNGA
jgi:DNA-directed RNA polymerase subunit RPC12/RpoP